jgi:hypothetical protein
MSKRYSTISLEGVSSDLVSEKVGEILRTDFSHPVGGMFVMGLCLSVSDMTEESKVISRSLQANGIDNDLFLPGDIKDLGFDVDVVILAMEGSIGADYLDVFSDALARRLSDQIKCKAILQIDPYESPLFIYDEGRVIYDFCSNYSQYFSSRRWRPVESLRD